ncbi:Uma2 family endonuclease [Anaerolineales bacterium HSG25]|nr:Uma2 family endonuclease [Anaerolineales bacterium HSG25]
MSIATPQLTSKTVPANIKLPELFWPEVNEASLKNLPTMYDLPSENKTEEPGVPDEFHVFQANLLSDSYALPNYPQEQIFTAADLNLYFNPKHPKWYKRPDWYAVVGVSRLYHGWDMRSSYVVWDEGIPPYIVIEFLSPSSMDEDLGRTEEKSGQPPPKWKVYEQILKIPYYLLFDRRTDQLQAFKLINHKYERIMIAKNRLWLPELKVGIGLWKGKYKGIYRQWLRWYDTDDNWLATPIELERQAKRKVERQVEQERQAKRKVERQVEQERQAKRKVERQVEQERQAKEQERQAKEKLAAKLRELGIDPNNLG